MPKQATVSSTQAARVGQNPRRGSSAGNTRNIGSVGTTYQNVYQAWLAILAAGCRSTCSQTRASTVTIGRAATRPPSLSLRLATSDTITTTAAVSRYLVMSQAMGPPVRWGEATFGGSAAQGAVMARPRAGSGEAIRGMRGPSARDVALQLVQFDLLVLDDRLDQVADRHHADHFALVHDRQVANALVGHYL